MAPRIGFVLEHFVGGVPDGGFGIGIDGIGTHGSRRDIRGMIALRTDRRCFRIARLAALFGDLILDAIDDFTQPTQFIAGKTGGYAKRHDRHPFGACRTPGDQRGNGADDEPVFH